MEKIIEELMHIEQQAVSMWDKLTKEKEAQSIRLKEAAAHHTAEINRETDRAIQKITQTLCHESDEKKIRIQTDHQEALARMEALFEKHHDSWHDRIVECILKV